LWNVRTMICIAVLAGVLHESQVLAAEFDFHGKYLVSCGMDKEILVWNLAELEQDIKASDFHTSSRKSFKTVRITMFAGRSNSLHDDFVDSIVRFGKSSFITRSTSGEIVWWKITEVDGKPRLDHVHSLNDDVKEESCWFVRMSLDQQGQFLSISDVYGNIRMFDLDVESIDDVKISIFATPNQKVVRMMSYSRDGSTMIAASDDGKILRYDKKAAIVKKEVVSID
jgi:WD40 repeat protein